MLLLCRLFLNERWTDEFLCWNNSSLSFFLWIPFCPQQSSLAVLHPSPSLVVRQQDSKRLRYLCVYMSNQAYKSGTRPFLRWVRSQGRSPHASSIAKNTSGPVGITLIRSTSGARQYPPPEVSKSRGGAAPWGWRKSTVSRHTRPDPCQGETRPAKCDPTTGEKRRKTPSPRCIQQEIYNDTKIPHLGQSHNVVIYMCASA